MVADTGPDVLILTLTWAYVVADATVHGSLGGRPFTRASG